MLSICFDLDGMLTDPKKGIIACIRYALEKLDIDVLANDEDYFWCIGPPLLDSFITFCGDEAKAEKALVYYRERFSEIGLYENEVYPGIEQLLKQCVEAGFSLYLATSKPHIYALQILQHFKLDRFFTAIHGAELDGTRSDKTELIKWIVKKEALDVKSTWMIGDRKYDMIGAQNNDLKSIGVLYGYGSRDELEDANADMICKSVDELQQILLSLK